MKTQNNFVKKLMLKVIFIIWVLLQNTALADDFNRLCNPPKDRPSEMACNYAVVHRTPIVETATAMFLAMMENTSNFCNTPLPEKYYKNVETASSKYPGIISIKKDFLSQFEKQDPPGAVGRRKDFCREQMGSIYASFK
jgi:hypothetical protein